MGFLVGRETNFDACEVSIANLGDQEDNFFNLIAETLFGLAGTRGFPVLRYSRSSWRVWSWSGSSRSGETEGQGGR
jgi:hypothetical protein